MLKQEPHQYIFKAIDLQHVLGKYQTLGMNQTVIFFQNTK